MALFIMRRYLGDEEKEEEDVKESRKSQHLAHLLAKIEERKQKRSISMNGVPGELPENFVTSDENVTLVGSEDIRNEPKKKKKNSIKHLKETEDENLMDIDAKCMTSEYNNKNEESNNFIDYNIGDVTSKYNNKEEKEENVDDEDTLNERKKKKKRKSDKHLKEKEDENLMNFDAKCEVTSEYNNKNKKTNNFIDNIGDVTSKHNNEEEKEENVDNEDVLHEPKKKKKRKSIKHLKETEDENLMDCSTEYMTSEYNKSEEDSTDNKDILNGHKKKKKKSSKHLKDKVGESLMDCDTEESKNVEMEYTEINKELLGTGSNEETVNIEDMGEGVEKDNSSQPEGFTILGGEFHKKRQVKCVLPYWLAHPQTMSRSLKNLEVAVSDIPELNEDLRAKLMSRNISHFFPVQYQVIPWLLSAHQKPILYRPQDICVSAPTGSGKTLAFVLPIVQILQTRLMHHVRALVLLPVQELAAQVYEVFKFYCDGTDLRVTLLSVQNSIQTEQELLVKTSPIIGKYSITDIVVATPGRLVDHLQYTPGFSLNYLEFLVMDEADRLMDNVQNNWLYHVEKHIDNLRPGCRPLLTLNSLQSMKHGPQKLLFSATLSQDPEKLQQLNLFQPKLFSAIHKDIEEQNGKSNDVRHFIEKYITPDELIEKYCIVEAEYKPLLLYHLISTNNWNRVLCFTNTQQNTNRLAKCLKLFGLPNLKVGELSSACSHSMRNAMLKKFSNGEIDVLVSSDALARGIDFPKVDYVISYDTPMHLNTYIHRIGRTARAGQSGTAISFVLQNEIKFFKGMLHTASKENMTEFSVQESELEYLEESYKSALRTLKNDLTRERYQKGARTNFKKQGGCKNVRKKVVTGRTNV